MRRGDLVTVALQGDSGKPRPALVVRSDLFAEHETVAVAPITSHLANAPLLRILVEPSPANGLQKISQIMVDRVSPINRAKIGPVIGRIDDDTMGKVERALLVWFGIA